MIQLVLTIGAAYLGYRRWGGWHGALRGVLILWVILMLVATIAVAIMFLGGGQVERILEP